MFVKSLEKCDLYISNEAARILQQFHFAIQKKYEYFVTLKSFTYLVSKLKNIYIRNTIKI